MATLVYREEQLVNFLERIFPDRRIIPTLLPQREAARRGYTLTPEIRVIPSALDERGIMQWILEFVPSPSQGEIARRIGTTGILTLVESLRAGLSGAENTGGWSSRGGRLERTRDGVDLWIETLEDAAVPPVRVCHSFHRQADPFALLEAPSIEAGSSSFPYRLMPGDLPADEEEIAVADIDGVLHLGRVLSLAPVLQTELATPRTIHVGALFHILRSGIAPRIAPAEQRQHRPGAGRTLLHTIDGRLHVGVEGEAMDSLVLVYQDAAIASLRPIMEFLDQIDPARRLLLVRPDQIIEEAVLESAETLISADCARGSLTIRLATRPAVDLAEYAGAEP